MYDLIISVLHWVVCVWSLWKPNHINGIKFKQFTSLFNSETNDKQTENSKCVLGLMIKFLRAQLLVVLHIPVLSMVMVILTSFLHRRHWYKFPFLSISPFVHSLFYSNCDYNFGLFYVFRFLFHSYYYHYDIFICCQLWRMIHCVYHTHTSGMFIRFLLSIFIYFMCFAHGLNIIIICLLLSQNQTVWTWWFSFPTSTTTTKKNNKRRQRWRRRNK